MRSLGGLRGMAILLLFATLSTLSGWFSVHYLTIFNMIELWLDDMRIVTLQPATPQHKEIIIVAITEETLERFPYRAPIDRQFLSDLLYSLESKGAKGILLDILLDQPTETEKDQALRTTLRTLKIPIVVSYTRDVNILTQKQSQFLDAFVPPDKRGMANLLKNNLDSTVRWIYPGNMIPDQGFLLGVAGVLAKHFGITPPTESIPIAWHGRPDNATEPFILYPAHLVPMLPTEWFSGKIVLIGADLSLTDRHRTPFSNITNKNQKNHQFGTSGVIIHAHALAQIMEQQSAPKLNQNATIILLFCAAIFGAMLTLLPFSSLLRQLLALSLLALFWIANFMIYQHNGPMLPLFPPTIAYILSFAAGELYLGREEREQRKFIKNAFSRYLAPAVVEQLLNNRDDFRLGGERREMTFLFTDVAGFTTLSEEMDATELTLILNQYLDGLCQVILRHEGTIINFIGDAIFALFGAPTHQEDHPCRAMACASEMDTFADSFQQKLNQQGVPFGLTRIGVHTGHAAIGNMGSEDRFQYTSLGDAVNTAARLEGFNKYVGSRIALSEETARRCPHLHARPIAAAILKGKSKPITVYEPLTKEQAESPAIQSYLQAYALLEEQQPEAAKPLFQALAEQTPPDLCAQFHLTQIQNGAHNTSVTMESK